MWWMTQRMGSSGRDIPFETQFLIVEGTDGLQSTGDGTGEQPVVYTVFLPILEGSFRAVLQGNADDELEICLESGKWGNRHHYIYNHLFFDLVQLCDGVYIVLIIVYSTNSILCCHDSGDPDVESFEGSHLVFVGAGSDPFDVITNSVK